MECWGDGLGRKGSPIKEGDRGNQEVPDRSEKNARSYQKVSREEWATGEGQRWGSGTTTEPVGFWERGLRNLSRSSVGEKGQRQLPGCQ